MTNTTIPPLTGDDVQALGYTPFGFENEARMGAVVAHKDGEAFYLQRAASFWSVDPEYGNMRGVLCEDPPIWTSWRPGCAPMISGIDETVLIWRVSDLPPERAARLFNHDTIAPKLAGLKAQGEPEPPIGNGIEHAPTAPPPRRPLKVGDRVMSLYRDVPPHVLLVARTARMVAPDGTLSSACQLDDATWVREDNLYLLLDDPATTGEA